LTASCHGRHHCTTARDWMKAWNASTNSADVPIPAETRCKPRAFYGKLMLRNPPPTRSFRFNATCYNMQLIIASAWLRLQELTGTKLLQLYSRQVQAVDLRNTFRTAPLKVVNLVQLSWWWHAGSRPFEIILTSDNARHVIKI
jgi:hypothetical protein